MVHIARHFRHPVLAALWIACLLGCSDEARPAQETTPAAATVLPENPAANPCAFRAQRKSLAGKPADADLEQLRYELTMPVATVQPGELLDNFGEARGDRQHNALDILAPRGTPVLSATAGCLLDMHENDNGGLMIFATDPADRFILMYAHLDSYAKDLTEGMPLTRGQVLGTVGTTGNAPSNTPHLHFAIGWSGGAHRWSKTTPVDPRPLLLTAEPLPEMRAAEGKPGKQQ